jgi:hypothetical protein
MLSGTYVGDDKVMIALEQLSHWHIDCNKVWR